MWSEDGMTFFEFAEDKSLQRCLHMGYSKSELYSQKSEPTIPGFPQGTASLATEIKRRASTKLDAPFQILEGRVRETS
jgi:hypothetical protein